MTAGPSEGIRVCPDCGAHSRDATTRCWLCGRSLFVPTGAADVDAPVMAQVVGERQPPRFAFSLASVLIVITLLAVILATYREAPGLSVALGIVAIPALVATSLKVGRRQAMGEAMTTSEKIGAFFLSAFTVLGAVALLVVASFVAFFLYCMYAFSM